MKAERSQYTVFKIEVLFDQPILFAEHSISSASVESTTIENPTAEDLKESGSLISFDCVVRGKPLTTRGT
jgi:hypothetical protein